MPLDLDYGNRTHNQRLADDADQVEIEALRFGSATIDSGLSDEHIAGAMDDFLDAEQGEVEEWEEMDLADDSGASGIGQEIRRRIELLGEAYPFYLDRNALICSPAHGLLTYKFCLVTSQADLSKKVYKKFPRVFEEVAQHYSQFHMGPFADSYHTGWPRADGTSKFKDMADVLHARTSEWFWGPEAGYEDSDASHIKDGGMDFLAWIRSPDNRPGQLFVVGQCACGRDWQNKMGDVDLGRLNTWFNPTSWVTLVRAFCLPYALVEAYLRDCCRGGGLVYDRYRLAMLSLNYEFELPRSLKLRMELAIRRALR